jgi:Icc protein
MKPAEDLSLVAPRLSRRGFVHRVALASTALLGVIPASAAVGGGGGRVRFGLIADIHPDVLPDGLARVQAFVKTMTEAKVDFILQLGDFVWPKPSNQPFLEAWNAFPGPRYHVLGNHDMDDGYTREQTVAFVGMPGMHYTFPAGPALGIVLDGNEPGGKRTGYRRFVGAAQLAWLEKELAEATKPCLLFIHQPFDAENDDAVENAAEVRAVVERAEKQRPGSVLAVFSGHLHLDYARVVNGIRYFEINSAAYWWLNNPAARREVYPSEVHKAYRWASSVAPYRDPLWAIVTLDLDRGELVIEGKRSEWIGPDPWARGETTDRPRESLHPWVSGHRVPLAH